MMAATLDAFLSEELNALRQKHLFRSLRVLEGHPFERIGGHEPIRVDDDRQRLIVILALLLSACNTAPTPTPAPTATEAPTPTEASTPAESASATQATAFPVASSSPTQYSKRSPRI